MSIGEQIFLRVFLVLLIALIVFLFRFVVFLVKKLFSALFSKNKAASPAKPAAGKQIPVPPAPPAVTPVQPPVVQSPAVQPPVVQPERTVPQYEQPVTMADPAPTWMPSRPKYQLRALNGPLAGRAYAIDGVVTIGRNPTSGIAFPVNTPGISGNHCLVSMMENTGIGTYDITLRDVGSTYGTFLPNGQRLAPNQYLYLHPGDVFLLGGPNGCAFRLENGE